MPISDIATSEVVMVLELKDDNTTGSLELRRLFYVLSIKPVSEYICTRVYLYTIIICRDGATIDMCLYMSLAAICVVYH